VVLVVAVVLHSMVAVAQEDCVLHLQLFLLDHILPSLAVVVLHLATELLHHLIH
jgi:hypothetical protein